MEKKYCNAPTENQKKEFQDECEGFAKEAAEIIKKAVALNAHWSVDGYECKHSWKRW